MLAPRSGKRSEVQREKRNAVADTPPWAKQPTKQNATTAELSCSLSLFLSLSLSLSPRHANVLEVENIPLTLEKSSTVDASPSGELLSESKHALLTTEAACMSDENVVDVESNIVARGTTVLTASPSSSF